MEAENGRVKEPERLPKQLLACLVAVEHGDGGGGHRSNDMARSIRNRATWVSDRGGCRTTRRRHQPERHQHAELVRHAPMLRYPPPLEADHVEHLDVGGVFRPWGGREKYPG